METIVTGELGMKRSNSHYALAGTDDALLAGDRNSRQNLHPVAGAFDRWSPNENRVHRSVESRDT